MNKIARIFLVIILILFEGSTIYAQTGLPQNDTINTKVIKSGSNIDDKQQNTDKFNNNQADKDNNKAHSSFVKQVKTARPDMSKARGARPPYIVRPTGSRIPNGIGRPAGAARPGHG